MRRTSTLALIAVPLLTLGLMGPAAAEDDEPHPMIPLLLTAPEVRKVTNSVPLELDVRDCYDLTSKKFGPYTLCVAGYGWRNIMGKKPWPSEVSFQVMADATTARSLFTTETVPRNKRGFGLFGQAKVIKQSPTEVLFIYPRPPDSEGIPLRAFAAKVIEDVQFTASCAHNGVFVNDKTKQVTPLQQNQVTQCAQAALQAQIDKLVSG